MRRSDRHVLKFVLRLRSRAPIEIVLQSHLLITNEVPPFLELLCGCCGAADGFGIGGCAADGFGIGGGGADGFGLGGDGGG